MKGIIFNEFEEMVVEAYGQEACETLISESDLKTEDGMFIGPETYPFEDLVAIVATASKVTGHSVEELVRSLGEYLFSKLAAKFPSFVKQAMDARMPNRF